MGYKQYVDCLKNKYYGRIDVEFDYGNVREMKQLNENWRYILEVVEKEMQIKSDGRQ